MVPLEDAAAVSGTVVIDPGSVADVDRVATWTRLWRTGVLHSCATAIDGNYDGPVRAFWQARFDAVRDGGVVVDVGTGNGALALLAAESARSREITLEVHGVDLADISPADAVDAPRGAFDGIRFHPATSLACLPFGDGGVDLLVSQFAFEYAPRDAAVAETLRVLGRRGAAAMVVHSADSVVARVSAERHRWFDLLLDESPLLAAADEVVEILARARTPEARSALQRDARAEAGRARFNASAAALLDRAREPGAGDVLGRFMPALSKAVQAAAHDPTGARRSLAALRDWLRDERERLVQLQAALLDGSALADLADAFRAAGHAVECGSLEQRAGIKLGWTLEVAARG